MQIRFEIPDYVYDYLLWTSNSLVSSLQRFSISNTRFVITSLSYSLRLRAFWVCIRSSLDYILSIRSFLSAGLVALELLSLNKYFV